MKKIIALVIILIVVIAGGVFIGGVANYIIIQTCCPESIDLYGTHWQSEDGMITFASCRESIQNGQMKVDGEIIEIEFNFLNNKAWIWRANSDELLADFNCSYKSKKRFVAEVWKGSTYFNKGDKITFYRVDE